MRPISLELETLMLCCSPFCEVEQNRIFTSMSSPQFSAEIFLTKAKYLRLAPLAVAGIKRIKDTQTEQEWQEKWTQARYIFSTLEKTRSAFFIHNCKLKAETEEMVAQMDRENIWAIPLKGPHFAERIFGNIEVRVVGDIDILIELADVDRAISILKDNGYQTQIPAKMIHERVQSHHVKLHHPLKKILLELHWDLVQPDRFPRFSQKFWGDAHLWRGDRNDLSLPGLWLYILIHHHEHVYGEYKTLLDCAWVCQTFDEQINLTSLAQNYDLQGCWGVTQKQLLTYLGDYPVWPRPESRLNFYQTCMLKKLEEIPYDVKPVLYWRKLYARLLLPHLTEILRSALRAIFPRKEAISFLGSGARIKHVYYFFSRLFVKNEQDSTIDVPRF
ncbi:nucleotidyltransferase family protein [candidate division CSSED10-310 bacterium]|uniref:Nucleotidyltransferase family protein n=1 Tax=candidate division CSSED10-310 bacterium TaxID=2855610 RepID=A0ABV6YTR7_UNCC1